MRPLRSRRPLAEEAADQIRDEILAGRLGQGERLVETRIAEALNISRGPVREAFKLLRAEGLLHEERNRGTYVVRLSSADVHEIYDLRAAIESRAAKLLARAGRPDDLETLNKALAELEQAADRGDVSAVSRTDLAFHETVCRLTGNHRLHGGLHALRADRADAHPARRAALPLARTRSPRSTGRCWRPSRRVTPTWPRPAFETHVEHAFGLVADYIEHLPGAAESDAPRPAARS